MTRAAIDLAGASPEAILQLQRTCGNRAVSGLVDNALQRQAAVASLASLEGYASAEGGEVDGELQSQIQPARGGGKPNRVQTKLTVGAAGDQYEQEADRVAAEVPAEDDPHVGQPTSGSVRRAVVQLLLARDGIYGWPDRSDRAARRAFYEAARDDPGVKRSVRGLSNLGRCFSSVTLPDSA
jgi:hypothetical protein